MNRKQKNGNVLFLLYSTFTELPPKFRELVCKECGWSTPTFYRKIRVEDVQGEVEINLPLSNAEKEGILKIAYIAMDEINSLLDRCKQGLK